MSYNEEQTLRLLAEGNEMAFNRIYARYSAVIYREAYRYLRSSDLAKDLVQEIFITIWDKRESFSDVKHFRAYVITMGKNLAYQYLLRLAKESRAKKEMAYVFESQDAGLEQAYQHKELEVLLEKTIDMLPEQQRQVFRLAKGKGMTYDAIAELLHISPNTVRNHMVAAKHFIKRHIQHTTFSLIYLIVAVYLLLA
jgi:RNA polymerase sigma-70 factor (family 1)